LNELFESGRRKMSYQEKKTVVSMLTGVLILAVYCVFAYLKYRTMGPDIAQDLSFWAVSMLVFIGIGIAAAIVTQIVFHIVIAAGGEIRRHITAEISKELGQTDRTRAARDEMDWSEFENEDEMDKLIGLKAMRISYVIVGVGFILALVTLVLKLPPSIMLNTIFISACLASLTEGAAQLYYYKKGI
jgi:uncharacterized membrane protein (UPF0136 family)